MSNNSKVTIRDIYDIVERVEAKIDKRLEKLEYQVDANTGFRNQMLAIAGVIGAIAGGAISIFWDTVTGEK